MCALIVHLGQRGIVTRACPHMLQAEHKNDPSKMQYDCAGDALRRDEPLGHLFLSPNEALVQPVCLRWSCLNDAYCGLKLNRLDLCLDVPHVRDQAIWRGVVAGTRQRRLRHKDTRFDNYISASSGARGVRFVVYDKHSEAPASSAPRTARPPEGTMRVEAQLHREWLRKAGFQTPGDINPAHATRLFMKSYRWVGLDRAVGGSPRRAPQSRCVGRGPVKLRNWWRWLEDRAAGLPETGTRPTVIDNENLARRGGYVAGLPPDPDLGPARRLDLQNGVEAAVTGGWAFRRPPVGAEHCRTTALTDAADGCRPDFVVTTGLRRVGRQTVQRVRHELGKRRQPTSARERERGRVYNWQPVIGTHAGSCTSYQLRATGQWRPAGADQPNSRRCSSCARAVKRVFLMHAGLQPTRPSSSAMATTPSIQASGYSLRAGPRRRRCLNGVGGRTPCRSHRLIVAALFLSCAANSPT